MYWIAGLLLLGCLCLGAFFIVRSPTFWINLVNELIRLSLPKVAEVVTKRNTPEVESEMQKCIRRGGEWDNFRKKCK